MTTRKRLLQVLAVLGMASALELTARPATAATPRFCTALCAENCASDCGFPCMTMGCTFEICTGVNGLYYPFALDCH